MLGTSTGTQAFAKPGELMGAAVQTEHAGAGRSPSRVLSALDGMRSQ